MTKTDARCMADWMLTKIRLEEVTMDNEECFKQNVRFNPFHSERVGMEQTLKALCIPFEYEFDNEYRIIAVTVKGQRVER